MMRNNDCDKPLVSVITPSFNQATWLGDNLESVRRQTYPHIEHIVVDGGSTDGTLAILRSSSVRWVSEPDRGQAHALNKAFSMSAGEIIGWLNSDDAYFSAEVVTGVVRTFDQHPDVIVVHGHAALVDAVGMIKMALYSPRLTHRALGVGNFIYQPSVFIRRAAITDNHLTDESLEFAMDRDLWLRLIARGEFMRHNSIIAVDRQHAARKSTVMWATVGVQESAMLADRYLLPIGRRVDAERIARKLGYRVAGLRLLRQSTSSEWFFAPGFRRLAFRQLFVRRERP